MSTINLTPAPVVTGSDLLEIVIVSIEHNWFCVRNPDGWLLYSKKLSDLPPQGLVLADIVDELESQQSKWQQSMYFKKYAKL